jgi:hypothetical protein
MPAVRRGVAAVGKSLLAQLAVVGFWLVLGLVLTLVFGAAGRFDRWVREHRISPTLLVVVTVLATVVMVRAWDETKAERQGLRSNRDNNPPGRAG